jgi:hypothetical protein
MEHERDRTCILQSESHEKRMLSTNNNAFCPHEKGCCLQTIMHSANPSLVLNSQFSSPLSTSYLLTV